MILIDLDKPLRETLIKSVGRKEKKMNALKAIIALIDGVYDDPDLLKFGALTPNKEDEIKRIAEIGLHLQHNTSTKYCWCEPEIAYRDPNTQSEVILHRRDDN